MRPVRRSNESRSVPIKAATPALARVAEPESLAVRLTPAIRTATSANPEKKISPEAMTGNAFKRLRFTRPSIERLLMPSSVRAFVPAITTFEPPPANLALSTVISRGENRTTTGSVALSGVSCMSRSSCVKRAVPVRFSDVKLKVPSGLRFARLPPNSIVPVPVPASEIF